MEHQKRKHSQHQKKGTSDASSEEEWVEKETDNFTSNGETSARKSKFSYRSSSEDSNSSSGKDITEKKQFSRRGKKSYSSDKSKSRQHSSSSEDSCSISSNENERINKKNCRFTPKKRNELMASNEGKSNIGIHSQTISRDLPSEEMTNLVKRDQWMNSPTKFSFSSSFDRRMGRQQLKKLEREKQVYNPRECGRELNPYWRNGGDGLPSFKKPKELDDDQTSYTNHKQTIPRTSNWKKKTINEQDLSIGTIEKRSRENNVSTENTITSEKELNVLAAKLVKAEIMGNAKLIAELKGKLEEARGLMKKANFDSDDVLLTHTDSQGRSQPLKLQADNGESSKKSKRKRTETHESGQRVRYFSNDDKYSLKQMFENEKYSSVEDQNKEFLKMTSKVGKNDDLDDIFADNIRNKESNSKIDSRNRDRAIQNHNTLNKSLNHCDKCIQSKVMLKHLMVSMHETAYLALPAHEPLTIGHCLIVPIRHVPCSTQLDENEWSDILDLRKSVTNLYKANNEEVIFFETAMKFHKFPHMFIECIPLPKEDGDMAPIYFKKAIDESEYEWSQNKKVVSLKGRDIRKAVPKGLPYFSVSFGSEEGFAHVIEDERNFPLNFAQEIIGGMMDLHHSKWRKPKKQNFEEQSERVLEFSKKWKHFDCT